MAPWFLRATFLADATALGVPSTLRPEMYEATSMTLTKVMAINIVYQTLSATEATHITKSAPAFRLKCIAVFTD